MVRDTLDVNRMWAVQAEAAKKVGIPTVETQMNDSLDFHTLSVWDIKYMLEIAYRSGYSAGYADKS